MAALWDASVVFRVEMAAKCEHRPTKREMEKGTDRFIRSIVCEPLSPFLSLEERAAHRPTCVAAALVRVAQSERLGLDLYGMISKF